jgi:hypothetical protein
LPESQRALRAAIALAQACNSELATVSILGDLPAYASFAIVFDPNAPNAMREDHFGVPYMTSHKKLPVVCSVCIEHKGRDQRSFSRNGFSLGGITE